MRRVAEGSLLVASIAAGTALFGWWAVPALGALWGFYVGSKARPIFTAAGAAALAWALLLAYSATRGPVGAVAAKLGPLFGVPGPVLYIVALAFAALLAGSAAGVTTTAWRLPVRRSGTS